MRQRVSYSILLLIYCLLPHSSLNAVDTQARAAIDFGSGAIKIFVALVDTNTNRIVGRPLMEQQIYLSLTEDTAAHNGYISEEAERCAMCTLDQIKEDAFAAAFQAGKH